jgi:hypothetical protein
MLIEKIVSLLLGGLFFTSLLFLLIGIFIYHKVDKIIYRRCPNETDNENKN